MKSIKHKFNALLAALALTAAVAVSAPAQTAAQAAHYEQLSKQVRHELVTLPYYGIFDNLAYQIEGDTVTLRGQVVRPITRQDAAARVAQLPGVTRVVNQIEVLPLSSFDDSIRRATYRAIFSKGSLYRYARGANPALHIIVRNGHVTLEGVVADEGDRNLAYLAANQVSGVFSVTNNLRTDRDNRAR